MAKIRDYDSTVARIAGNLLSGDPRLFKPDPQDPAGVWLTNLAKIAVRTARVIVEETRRTEPKEMP